MAVKKVKAQAINVPVPQNEEQANNYIAAIGEAQREVTRLETLMNDEIAAIKNRYESMAQPLNQKIEAQMRGVQTWCEANRTQITNGGKVKFWRPGAGEVKWRMRPEKVTVRNADLVLEELRKRQLHEFIRAKEEINKERILAQPERVADVPGISISQGEDFVVVPFSTQIERVA